LNIRIYYDEVKFRLRDSGKVKKFLEEVIVAEKKRPGDLSFIFTNDNKLLGINKRFLEHDYYTDVISFSYNEGRVIKGEVYISIDTVRRNASFYGSAQIDEVLRVMIHGTLHLCGYGDTDEEELNKMEEIQEMYLRELRRIL